MKKKMKEYDELKLEINDNEIIETETKSNKKLDEDLL